MGCCNNKTKSEGEQIVLSVFSDMKIMFLEFENFYQLIFKEYYEGKINGSKTISKEEFLNIANKNLRGEELLQESKLKGVQNYIFEQIANECVVEKEENNLLCVSLLNYFLPLFISSDKEKVNIFVEMCVSQSKVENFFFKNNEIYKLVRRYLESNLIFYTKCVYQFIINNKIDVGEEAKRDLIRILWLCNFKNFKQFMKETLNVSFDLKCPGLTQLETFREILLQNSFIFNSYQLRETYYNIFTYNPVDIYESNNFDFSILNDQ
jgi:hypothetical protein